MQRRWTYEKVFFFKKIKKIGDLGRWAKNTVGFFQLNAHHTFCHCLPSSGFSINQPLFLKNLFLRYFYLGCTELGVQPSCVRSPWLGESEDSIKVGVFSKKLFITNSFLFQKVQRQEVTMNKNHLVTVHNYVSIFLDFV